MVCLLIHFRIRYWQHSPWCTPFTVDADDFETGRCQGVLRRLPHNPIPVDRRNRSLVACGRRALAANRRRIPFLSNDASGDNALGPCCNSRNRTRRPPLADPWRQLGPLHRADSFPTQRHPPTNDCRAYVFLIAYGSIGVQVQAEKECPRA